MEALNTQSLDALERASTHSARDEHEKEADAAAGPEDARSSHSDLLLPLEARGKSRVGCAQQAHLEQALADTTQLQSQADAALERMTRQSRALKRIPVTCPSCGTLNVPSGSTWSVGDLVPCQECSQPFLPLSNSFQETDLLVLKTAVKRLRDQAEQIQYLETCLQKNVSTAPGPRLSPTAPPEPWSPSRFGSPVERLDARQFLSPCSPVRNDRGRSGDSPSSPESGHLEAAGAQRAHTPSVPQQSAPLSRLPISGDPLSPPQATRDDRMPQQQLMSFLDTQDLLTNSSSSSAPMFHGSKLASQLDTEQKTREVLHRLRKDLPERRVKREREEGEIFSASESEAGSRWPSQEMRLRSSPGVPPQKQGVESRLLEEVPGTGGPLNFSSPVTSGLQWQYLLKLFACLAMVCSLRCLLRRCLAEGLSEVATSILAALITGGGLTLWRWAEQTVERQDQLETSKSLSSFKHGLVCVHWELAGRDWQLSTEEAFGLACLLGEIAPVFIFENWGLHGSARYRWMAVVAHVASSLGLVVLVRRKLVIQVSEAWMGLAAGNWVASTWAAYTWWPAAGDQARLPVLALATVQLVNFWLAQNSGQPLLLASCIALGGLSMAGVCLMPVAVAPNQGPSPLLAPGIYLGFCVVSALLLFQEFFMSL